MMRSAGRCGRAILAVLAGGVVIGLTAVPVAGPAAAARTAAAAGPVAGAGAAPAVSAGASAGLASRVLAQAQFAAAPAAIPSSSGARQVCRTPVRPGQMECMALLRTRAAPSGRGVSQPPRRGYSPVQLQSAYRLTSAAATEGSGRTIAIVDAFNDPHAVRDLAAYRKQYKLGCATHAVASCLRIVNQAGKARPLPAADPSGAWELEESLDLDMVSAICPRCEIVLVEAASDSISDLAAAESYAAGHADVVSNSWGSGAEFTGENAFDPHFDHPGVAIVASSGDSGYGTQYPAASQFVTAVGGTTLRMSGTAVTAQAAWSLTGSGCSAFEPKPAWQRATPGGCRNRTETDVSADANPSTGVAVFDTYPFRGIVPGWTAPGGTSVATPIIAGAYALAGTPAPGTFPASFPYYRGSDLADITSGSNGSCEASRRYLCRSGAGYDGPTGLGTPAGVGGFTGPAAAVTVIDPGTQDVAVGTQVRLRITAAVTGQGRLSYTSAGLPAGLRLDTATGVISGRPARPGTFAVTVTATGTGSAAGAGSGSVSFSFVVLRRLVDPGAVTGPVRLDAGGSCLQAGGRAAGSTVRIWPCDGRRAQDWRYVPAGSPGGPGLLKIYGRCLTARSAAAGRVGAARVGAALVACTGGASQQWLYRSRDQLYDEGHGKCLAGPGQAAKRGARVSRCHSGAGQSWMLPPGPVLSGLAGRCLTDPGDRAAAGPRIETSPCDGRPAQRWTMRPDRTLRIVGHCLAVAGRSMRDGAAVELSGCSGRVGQKWSIGPNGELVNGNSGRCLADPGGWPAPGASAGSASRAGTGLVQEDCYGEPGEIWVIS